ncbi:hypothetical protein EDD86DRAFT_196302 [Gorgonomyces haynaldii]|nr:hypothetical protein EDD86DRAFT_196302 [Gorgonomyces haynaldii]
MHLLTLESIRERAHLLLNNPKYLNHFDLHLEKLDEAADRIIQLIKRDYKTPQDIPPHSRKRHFEAGGIDRTSNVKDIVSLLDLFVVGVLLDAGAGSQWTYQSGAVYSRSEGLGVASYDMFMKGLCASDGSQKADAQGLLNLTPEKLAHAFQVSDKNPLVGVEGRTQLLQRLGQVCLDSKYFAPEKRPGSFYHFLINHPTTEHHKDGKHVVDVHVLWEVVMNGFSGVWPRTRTQLDGVFLGDVWPLEAFKRMQEDGLIEKGEQGKLMPFHKLSQWLTYSLMDALATANVHFKGAELMTGLAEYRNGGLFVDLDIIVPRQKIDKPLNVHDDLIVEWRSLTIALLDRTAVLVRERLQMTEQELPLAKVLEAGTWKLGRELAAAKRPSKGPPIEIVSDGTIF